MGSGSIYIYVYVYTYIIYVCLFACICVYVEVFHKLGLPSAVLMSQGKAASKQAPQASTYEVSRKTNIPEFFVGNPFAQWGLYERPLG